MLNMAAAPRKQSVVLRALVVLMTQAPGLDLLFAAVHCADSSAKGVDTVSKSNVSVNLHIINFSYYMQNIADDVQSQLRTFNWSELFSECDEDESFPFSYGTHGTASRNCADCFGIDGGARLPVVWMVYVIRLRTIFVFLAL